MNFTKRKGFIFGAVAVSAMALIGCGDETTTNVVEQTGMQIVAAGEKMAKCSDSNVGEMIFVSDSAAVYYCDGDAWQTLNGKDGVDGKDSKPGTAVNGEDGKGCTAADTVSADGLAGYNLDCADKRVGTIWNGKNGEDGKDGEEGKTIKGEDGKGCTAADTVSADGVAGYNLDCADKRVGTIWNGKDGEEGKDLVAEYDTVTTEFLNQKMLAEGKYGILVDKRDNKVYRTIEIGTQTWMAQNLDYSDGGVTSYCYDNDLKNCEKYGRLYMWAQAMNLDETFNTNRALSVSGADSILVRPVQGLCPNGWHVPDTLEWNTLETWISTKNYLEYDSEEVGVSLKVAISEEWMANPDVSPGADRYGFSALPAGDYSVVSMFNEINQRESWWSSNEFTETRGRSRNVNSSMNILSGFNDWKVSAISVRCLKNSD